ncbi:MAG: type I glyceraldehyde-3-phosphate dehydrogenase [Vulcanimicrobiota bacterium]
MNVGINGFGRIGRLVLRGWLKHKDRYDFDVVAINDLGDPTTMVHLFKYDSTFGPYEGDVKYEDGKMIIDGTEIKMLSEKDPTKLPWKELGVEYVVESTGVFRTKEKASLHMKGGARKVIISAPAKGSDVHTIVMGVNENTYNPEEHDVLSNASCTTNCLAPVAKVLHDKFKIESALMTTIHAYTNDQRILDLPHSDLRRARAAALNIIPTTTGAAKATAKVIPDLKGKIDGMAIRVPTPDVSVVDLVVKVEKSTTREEVNNALKAATNDYLGFSEEPLVSMDYKGNNHSSIVDADSTMVIEGNTVKVLAWYDNEWGYSMRMLDLIAYMMKKSPAKV